MEVERYERHEVELYQGDAQTGHSMLLLIMVVYSRGVKARLLEL